LLRLWQQAKQEPVVMILKEEKEIFEGLSLLSCLGKIEDPRIERRKLYPLREILLIALCALMSGHEGFRTFELYGQVKVNFFPNS
jgi:hypothetical protein